MAGVPVTGSVTFALFTKGAALRVASSLEIDASIRPANNSRNKRKRAFKPFVHIGGVA